MQVVHVHMKVKPEFIESFKIATRANVAASSQEPGIARFEFYQEKEDETRFILVEAYRTEEDPARHKETAHYATWRDTVAGMMEEPRQGVWFTPLAPDGSEW